MIENAGCHMVDHGVHTLLIDHLEVPVSGNDIPDHQQWSLSGVNSVAEGSEHQELLSLTTEIVASFAGHHTVAVGDLPAVIASVFQALRGVGQGEADKPAAEAPVPAVPVKKSIGTDFLVCLEDGKKVKTLKRHLASHHQLTPDRVPAALGLGHGLPDGGAGLRRAALGDGQAVRAGPEARGRGAAATCPRAGPGSA